MHQKCLLICLIITGGYCQRIPSSEQQDFLDKLKEVLRKIDLDLTPECSASYWDMIEKILPILQLIDSSAKLLPTGMAGGNFYDLGNFDECYNFEAINKISLKGKYCLGAMSVNLPQSVKKMSLENFSPTPVISRRSDSTTSLPFRVGYCTVHTCTAKDFSKIMSFFLNTTFNEDECYSKATEPEIDAGAIVTIAILAFFGAIIIISTAYDVRNYYQGKKTAHELLVAFSFLSNGRKLLQSSNNSNQLLCLNGIRAISMAWVILGHEYSLFSQSPIANIFEAFKFATGKENMWMMSAPLSVDSFFLMGGLVTMYAFMGSMEKGVKFNILLYYVHRYLRLTPILGIMTLIHAFLLNLFGTGPIWNVVTQSMQLPCRVNWWAGLIYMQNYTWSYTCVPQTWYLSVDMQLFLLSPIILYPMMKNERIGYYMIYIACIAGILVPFNISYALKLNGFVTDANDPERTQEFNGYYYGATYSRFGPYAIGMLFGYHIYKNRKNQTTTISWNLAKLSVVSCLWMVVVGLLFTCLYSGADLMDSTEYHRIQIAFYNALHRNAWAICLGFVILLCTSGMGGPINDFLSLPIFQFLAKVSYCMYLVHYPLITLRWSSFKNANYFSNFFLMHIFWGDFIYTLVISVILSLSFESPVIILEKYIFGRK